MLPGSKNSSAREEQGRLSAKKPILRIRSRIIQSIRRFFIERDYLETETPCLIPAPAPEANIDAIPSRQGFLQTSPELCMKRLLAAGYHRIFQVSRCFREGERGSHHLPEFTMLEWYRAGIDYQALMDECEELFLFACEDLGIADRLVYQGLNISLTRPWERISVTEAFERFASLPMKKALELECFDKLMVSEIEPHLGISEPTFLYDYPSSLAALARLKRSERGLAERFELYVGGLELANAFSELTDVDEQKRRFKKEREKRERGGRDVYPLPEKFLDALQHMPRSAGIALGVDRLVMVLTDQKHIDKVVAFTPEEL
ncbi:EF-P lysine aminoacylase EpmA [Thermodesulfobacteriota bacterium]